MALSNHSQTRTIASRPQPAPARVAGTLLFDAESAKLVGFDGSAQTTIGLDTEMIGQITLREILPDMILPDRDISELSKTAHQNDKQTSPVSTRAVAVDGQTFDSRVQIALLKATPNQFLLATLLPENQDAPPNAPVDALTGLPDRRQLAGYRQQWQQSSRERLGGITVLFMDLDRFKPVNDRLGHAVGDEVLKTLAQRWQGCLRDDDLVVRYGGDEFIVLLTGIASREAASPIMDRIRQATSQPISIGEELLSVGVTIGVASSNSGSVDLDALVAAADRDMYAEKQAQ